MENCQKILIVAATRQEILPLLEFLIGNLEQQDDFSFRKDGKQIDVLITGVGMMATAYHLGSQLSIKKYDLVLNIGIAGTFRRDWALGTVVQIVSEELSQLGAEKADSSFVDVFELGLLGANDFPFNDGKLVNTTIIPDVPKAKGVTVSTTSGSNNTIKNIVDRYQPDIESMESAAFFYACLQKGLKFMAFRAISNYVEPRNKDNWKIGLAVQRVNDFIISFLF